jgi:lysophospholipase L1-like esterase
MIPKFKDRSHQTTQKHRAFLKRSNNQDFDCIMIGTSMLERFLYDQGASASYDKNGLRNYNVFNCGVGGDKICNILYRLQTLQILDFVNGQPKCIILECGANDVEAKNIKFNELCEGIKMLIDIIKQKFSCPVFLIGVFPRKSKFVDDQQMVKRIKTINQMLKKEYPDSLCDWSDEYLDGGIIKTEYYLDDVHFNEQGYDIFARHIRELLEKYAQK